MSHLGNSKIIAKNTLLLYTRTFIVMLVSIFTSRIVLNVLGETDYGIYNIVGGFVAMFGLLSSTLTTASQRFISFELGKSNSEAELQKIFSVTVLIHIALAVIILILLESFGLWFINNKMNIASDRLFAANIVFHCSVLTFCINLISIPYNAEIIAHEHMDVFAYISIIEVVFKLAAAYTLVICLGDKLIIYAIMMLTIALILRLIYGIFCKRNYAECKLVYVKDKSRYTEILSFCSWNIIGSASVILNSQGINILINLFFGVLLNAARGLAEQINSALNSFVANFMTALNPQITKCFAAKEYEQLNKLIMLGGKLAFCLLWLISFPVITQIDALLGIWLMEVPDHTASFVILALVYTLCQSLSQTLYTAMLASGNIKKYQITVGSISLCAFPITYIFYKFGLPVEFGYVSTIIISILCLIARLIILPSIVPLFSSFRYIKSVILRAVLTSSSTLALYYILFKYSAIQINTLGAFFIALTLAAVCIVIFGFTGLERKQILSYIMQRI